MAGKLPVKIDMRNTARHVSKDELAALAPTVKDLHARLEKREGPAADWAGWLRQPSRYPQDVLDYVKATAREIRDKADAFVVIGIGGSYLGARAAVEFLADETEPEVIFAGYNLGADQIAMLEKRLKGRSVYVNMVSRGGGTVEPGVSFRFLCAMVERNHSKAEARERIMVTTRHGSPLHKLAEKAGYRPAFDIPADIGGRYSAFTPVVMLPAAVAGANLDEYLAGGADAEGATRSASLSTNPAYKYAAIRKLLYGKGKIIEVMGSFDPSLLFLGEWWRQLAGESEGKMNRGIFPATVNYTADLHSMGQWLQEGKRNVFETFLTLGSPANDLKVPAAEGMEDGFDYLAGKSVSEINRSAYEATAKAHLEGGVPNLTIELPARTERVLGGYFYFLMRAVAMTGMLFRVNPFDQPGVEVYKQVMYRLLGKPGSK